MPDCTDLDLALALLEGSDDRGFIDVTTFVACPNPVGRPRSGALRRPPVDFEARDLTVGSMLRRTYSGQDHIVYVVPPPASAPPAWRKRGWGRYLYGGERHKTLTAIARRIVGHADEHVSGNRFFGLRRKRDAWLDLGIWQRGVVLVLSRLRRRQGAAKRGGRLVPGRVFPRT